MGNQMNDGEITATALDDIKKGHIAPCYLLYGEEEYLIQETLNRLIEAILPPDDRVLNLHFWDSGQENMDQLCQSLLAAPLLPGRKLVVIRNTSLFQSKKLLPDLVGQIHEAAENHPERVVKEFVQFLHLTGWNLNDLQNGQWQEISAEEWRKVVEDDSYEESKKWLPKMIDICLQQGVRTEVREENLDGLSKVLAGGLPEGHHLIITASAIDKRKQLFKQLSAVGRILHFPKAKNEAGQKFLLLEAAQEFLGERGKKMTPSAWDAIGVKTGYELRESMLALEKLLAYTGEAATVDAADVEAVVGQTKEERVFDLTAAMVEKKLPRALSILKDLLEQGIHHLVVMKMLTREVRLLLYAQLLLKSGTLTSYRPGMDYGRFQASVYPVIKPLGGKEKDGLGSLTNQHPYVIYRTLKSAHAFPYEALLSYLEHLATLDLAFRSTGRNPHRLLERFLTEVCITSREPNMRVNDRRA